MKTSLLRLLLVLAAFAAGERFGLWLHRPIEIHQTVVVHPTADDADDEPTLSTKGDEGAAGSFDPFGWEVCGASWVQCWERT